MHTMTVLHIHNTAACLAEVANSATDNRSPRPYKQCSSMKHCYRVRQNQQRDVGLI